MRAPDGNPIIATSTDCWFVGDGHGGGHVRDSMDYLGPVVWISDELMNRATWVTNRQLPGQAEEPATRQGEPWIKIVRVPIIGELEAWTVEIITPILKGEKRGRRFTYILESHIRDEPRCITRMRWPD
jgi:hypothetical protein